MAAVLRTLKRLSNARYEGFETVSRLEVPVRVGLDTAVRVPGAGTLVTGWVLDPDHHVSAITLKGIGLSARIDLDWCRTNRRDVSEAFAKDAPSPARSCPARTPMASSPSSRTGRFAQPVRATLNCR